MYVTRRDRAAAAPARCTGRCADRASGGGDLELRKPAQRRQVAHLRAAQVELPQALEAGERSDVGHLDPLIAVNARTGKKLEGEIERRALELWNPKSVKAQKELGFRSGGHGATAHGDDVTPAQWAKFAKYAAVHMTQEEPLVFEALVVKRAGLPEGTKILPAGIKANEHLVRTTASDTWHGPLGTVLD